jgi:hypothetical protein
MRRVHRISRDLARQGNVSLPALRRSPEGGMSTPFIGFDGSTLKELPKVKSGDEILCDKCNGRHILEQTQCDGKWSEFVLVYRCGDGLFLGAVNGSLVAHSKPDMSGTL